MSSAPPGNLAATSPDQPSDADAELARQVRYLLDCEEIRQMMYSYARGVDRLDEELMANAYHADAYDNHGSWQGDKITAIATLMSNGRKGSATASTHQLGNMKIDIEGDTAFVETYFMAFQRLEEDGKTITRTRAGRYFDRLERRSGKWGVFSRRVIDDWSRLDEVVATAREIGANSAHGKRDKSDPTYDRAYDPRSIVT